MDKKEQISLYIIILFGALMLGAAARLGALMAGVDNFTATVIFWGATALGIALYLMIRVVLEEPLNWLLNKLFSSCKRVVKIEKPEESYTTSPQTEIESIAISSPTPTTISEIKTEQPTQEIEVNMIFRPRMFDKFLALENRLIKDKYLSEELKWISMNNKGKIDIKRLVTFLTALLDKDYFMPSKDPKIKLFFEARYRVSIGQNFEKRRREALIEKYPIIFYDYPF